MKYIGGRQKASSVLTYKTVQHSPAKAKDLDNQLENTPIATCNMDSMINLNKAPPQ